MDLSTLQQRKAFAKNYAEKHGIQLALLCAVIEHESSWNTYAIRYEPAFYLRYVQPQMGISDTEKQARAFSWGLMQIMGQVARELGFDGRFLSELTDPDVGVDLGCRKLRKCIDQVPNETLALLRYNGGSDKTYPAAVLQLKPKYVEETG